MEEEDLAALSAAASTLFSDKSSTLPFDGFDPDVWVVTQATFVEVRRLQFQFYMLIGLINGTGASARGRGF